MGVAADGIQFIGREAELARLSAASLDAQAGKGRTIIVGGEAGVGKTWLLERFATSARADGMQVISGSCLDFGGHGLPFAPFVEALRTLVRSVEPARLPALLGPARRGLAHLLPELDGRRWEVGNDMELDRSGRARLFELVLNVIERISRSTPVALVIEDVQWADGDTRDLIGFLVRHLRSSRVLTILSVRTDEPDHGELVLPYLAELERDDWVERIELRPFDRRDLGRVLTSRAGHAPTGELLDDVFARTGGNPFYVEQLLAIQQTGHGDSGRRNPVGADSGQLPQRLRDILVGRLAELPPKALEVVRVAAVAARPADDEMLTSVLGWPYRELADALRTSIDDGVLVTVNELDGGVGGVAFRHALLQEVAYAQLLPGERIQMHAGFAFHLATRRDEGRPVDASELAFHLDGSRQFARAVPVLIEAGAVAERACAFGQAGRQYERALELWDEAGMPEAGSRVDLVWVTQRAAECALLTGNHQRAIECGRQAIAIHERADRPDSVRLSLLRDRLRWYLWDSGDRRAAEAAVADALRLIPSNPPSSSRARALAQAAGLRMEAGELVDAMRFAREAITMAKAVGGGGGEEALAGGILGWCQTVSGDVEAGIATFRSALAIAKRLGGPEGIALGYANLASLLDRVGRTEAALEVALDGFQIVRDLGVSRTYGGVLLGHAAKALFDLGRWAEAASIADEGLDLDPVGRSAIELHLARVRIHANQGRPDEAAGDLDRAHKLAEFSGQSVTYGPALLAADADLARQQSRFADVRTALEQGVAFVADDRPLDPALGWLAASGLRTEADAAELARARHDSKGLTLATDLATGIIAFVERASSGPATAADVRREAMLALCRAERRRVDGSGDQGVWAEVVQRWEALRRPYPAAYARYRLGEALLASRGSRSDAAAALREAHDVVIALGAAPLRAEIELLAKHARIDLRVDRREGEHARPGGASDEADELGLTDRETDVIRLVAAGWSNQQIADELFITRKTASVHVSNIIGKFGVRNRVEAAAIAHRVGLGGDPPPTP